MNINRIMMLYDLKENITFKKNNYVYESKEESILMDYWLFYTFIR